MRYVVVALVGTALLAGCGGQGSFTPRASMQQALPPAQIADSQARRYDTRVLPAGFTPVAVMKDGQIPGYSGNEAAIVTVRDPDAVKMLGLLPGYDTSVATSANASGVAVGYATNSTYKDPQAIEFTRGKVIDLRGHNFGSGHESNQATSINDVGTIMGTELIDADSSTLEFYRRGRDAVPAPNGGDCGPPVINDAGDFVAPGGSGGVCTNMPALGPPFFSASWVDEAGDVVGSTGGNEPFPAIALLHHGHVSVVPIPSNLAGAYNNVTEVDEVNGTLEFVGPPSSGTAYVYANGKFSELQNLTAPGSPPLVNAIGLDDAGDIVAQQSTGPWVLLTPQKQTHHHSPLSP